MKNTLVKADKSLSSKFYSFDIFDTLVTRKTVTPEGIFAIIEQKISKLPINDFVKTNFFKIRLGAQNYARMNSLQLDKTCEFEFDTIYFYIQRNYNLSNNEVKFLKEVEIATEIENLLPIEKNINKLKTLIKSGEKVVLISDMYYGSDLLRYILSHVDSIFNNIKIYSSADYKVSKNDGRLYKIVAQQENVDFDLWTHTGDNDISDIKRAKRFGIKTIQFSDTELMPYEKYLLKHNNSDPYSNLVMGAAKLARMGADCNINNRQVYNFGCSFAAPLLYMYVDWLLKQSISRGFKTLYFIARDGYIPKIIADIIIEKYKLPIKTKYIYGSRLAWRIPTEQGFEDYVDVLFSEYPNLLNLDFIAYRLGISSDTLKSILGTNIKTDKILNKKQRKYFDDLLKNNAEIKLKFLKINYERKEVLKQYLKQEINLKEQFAFIDLYGTGKTQDCIASFLNEICDCTIYTMYFLSDYRTKQHEKSIKFNYFSTQKYHNNWIEILSRSLEGQTIGYKKENDKIIPITESNNMLSNQLLNWGYEDYIHGIINFTLNMCNINIPATLNCYCGYVEYLENALDCETATILGDIPWSSIGKENKVQKAAPYNNFINLLLDFLLCKKHNVDFPVIEKARAGIFCKFMLNFIEKYPTLQKFLFNITVRKASNQVNICIWGVKISLGRLIWRK